MKHDYKSKEYRFSRAKCTLTPEVLDYKSMFLETSGFYFLFNKLIIHARILYCKLHQPQFLECI